MFKYFLLLALITVSYQGQAARKTQIKVDGALKESLNGLLKEASDLHKACYTQNEPQIATRLKGILVSIKKAQRTTNLAKEQKTHLNKILAAIQSQIKMIQNNNGSDRKNSLQNAFQQIVQIAKVYKLDRYRVFFCSKDKSVWIQKSYRPQNPIHPEKYKNCGKRVR